MAAGGDPKAEDAFQALFAAIRKYPLVGICEHHQLQEEHDFLVMLLERPDLPAELTDIVVEFGNALHQDVADSYFLDCSPVDNSRLENLWRYTIGGGVLWDSPVYEQFFRAVRAVNVTRPRERRLRVLLGDPPFDHTKVQTAADKPYVMAAASARDQHYAGVIEREVLAKHRHALLIAGTGHLLHGVKEDRTGKPNAASLLDKSHQGALFVADVLFTREEPGMAAREAAVLKWPRPSLAMLADNWLGQQPGPMAQRASDPKAASFAAEADAVLYLGTADTFTASRPEPALYQGGDYAKELERLIAVAKQMGLSVALDGMAAASQGPKYLKD